jgi:hypothetical protein
MARTTVMWKHRLYALGSATVVSAPLCSNNPGSASIGNSVFLSSQFVLADLRVGEG